MMEALFLRLLNMSFNGGVVILLVLLARLLLQKAPKRFAYALWSVALFRLVCPVSFESAFSLLPTRADPIPADIAYAQTPQIHTGIPLLNQSVNQLLPAAEPTYSANPLQIWLFAGQVVWLAGLALLLGYSLISLLLLYRRLRAAVPDGGNVYLVDGLESPFVLGLLHPRIYLPAQVTPEEKRYILPHERAHIRRLDHVVKALGFLVLCLHWFNPLVWIAFFVSGRDMEMSCDELVVGRLGEAAKKEYSSTLLHLATGRRIVGGSPLAFGEGDTKARIKNVLRCRTPALWAAVVCAVAVATVCLGLAANPKEADRLPAFAGDSYQVAETLYDAPMYSFTYPPGHAPRYAVDANGALSVQEPGGEEWVYQGVLSRYELDGPSFLNLFFVPLEPVPSVAQSLGPVYRLDTGNESGTFYLVLEQEGRAPLLAVGYDRPEGTQIRWLFRLQPENDMKWQAAVYACRTSYIGDNAKVGNLLDLLPLPDGMARDGFALSTAQQPYGVTVNLTVEEWASARYNGDPYQLPFLKNAALLFSLVENADWIAFRLEAPASVQTIRITRQLAEEVVGVDLWRESGTPEAFAQLYERIETQAVAAISSAARTMDAPVL